MTPAIQKIRDLVHTHERDVARLDEELERAIRACLDGTNTAVPDEEDRWGKRPSRGAGAVAPGTKARVVAAALAAAGGTSTARKFGPTIEFEPGLSIDDRIHRTSATLSNLSRCVPAIIEKGDVPGEWRLTDHGWTALDLVRPSPEVQPPALPKVRVVPPQENGNDTAIPAVAASPRIPTRTGIRPPGVPAIPIRQEGHEGDEPPFR